MLLAVKVIGFVMLPIDDWQGAEKTAVMLTIIACICVMLEAWEELADINMTIDYQIPSGTHETSFISTYYWQHHTGVLFIVYCYQIVSFFQTS